MKKLVFLIRSLGVGGAERQLVTLANSLEQGDLDITILVLYSGGGLEKALNKGKVRLISLEKEYRWDLLFFLCRLVSTVRSLKPDIIHSYMGSANVLTVLLTLIFPNIKVVWGIRASNMDLSKYDWLSLLIYKLESLFSHLPDLIIVNSHAGKQYHLTQGFSGKRMTVVPNGIDTQRFTPDLNTRKRVRTEFEIGLSTILIGLVARLDPMKDHPTFLRGIKLLLEEHHNVKFICVGGGNEEYGQDLYNLANVLGINTHVIWAGERTDLSNIYNAIDILTSSSCSEGFSNVIGEAMSCGVPCVVTDVGDSAWIVGDSGLVVPPQNPEALANAWKKLLQQDLEQKGHDARRRIVDSFGVDRLL